MLYWTWYEASTPSSCSWRRRGTCMEDWSPAALRDDAENGSLNSTDTGPRQKMTKVREKKRSKLIQVSWIWIIWHVQFPEIHTLLITSGEASKCIPKLLCLCRVHVQCLAAKCNAEKLETLLTLLAESSRLTISWWQSPTGLPSKQNQVKAMSCCTTAAPWQNQSGCKNTWAASDLLFFSTNAAISYLGTAHRSGKTIRYANYSPNYRCQKSNKSLCGWLQ